jgi:hypothetical protein
MESALSEQVILWFLGEAIVLAGIIVAAYIKLLEGQNRHAANAVQRHNDLDNRVVKLETLINLFGKKAATHLHSPHTPELDVLLDAYIDRHYELSREQWQRLRELCDEVTNDKANKGDKVVFAAFLAAVADHKLELPGYENETQTGPH